MPSTKTLSIRFKPVQKQTRKSWRPMWPTHMICSLWWTKIRSTSYIRLTWTHQISTNWMMKRKKTYKNVLTNNINSVNPYLNMMNLMLISGFSKESTYEAPPSKRTWTATKSFSSSSFMTTQFICGNNWLILKNKQRITTKH